MPNKAAKQSAVRREEFIGLASYPDNVYLERPE
jgi:hypothetical protein